MKGECGMNGVLYECQYEFHFMFLMPLIMLVATIIISVLHVNDLKRKSNQLDNVLAVRIVKIFYGGLILFEIIVLVLEIRTQIDLYKKTVVAYQNGDYQIVEGYVENFEPMGKGGYPPEKFEINGVRFEYATHKIVPGYHKGETQGDFILGDGQHLKIGYIYYGYGYDNIIIYIEALP